MSILEDLFGRVESDFFDPGFEGNVRGSAAGQVAAHHAVPRAAANQSLLLQSLARFGAGEGDLDSYYNHNSFDANGQWLPTDPDKAYESGMALHQGSHPQYTEGLVNPQLERFQRDLERKLDGEVQRRVDADAGPGDQAVQTVSHAGAVIAAAPTTVHAIRPRESTPRSNRMSVGFWPLSLR